MGQRIPQTATGFLMRLPCRYPGAEPLGNNIGYASGIWKTEVKSSGGTGDIVTPGFSPEMVPVMVRLQAGMDASTHGRKYASLRYRQMFLN